MDHEDAVISKLKKVNSKTEPNSGQAINRDGTDEAQLSSNGLVRYDLEAAVDFITES